MSIQFQPIVDTAVSRVFAYQCSQQFSQPGGSYRAERENRHGRYASSCSASTFERKGPLFVKAGEKEVQSFVHEAMPRVRDIVYQFRLWGPLNEFPDLGRARDAHRGVRLSLALELADADADSMSAVERLRPDYIKLAGALTAGVEKPCCAVVVRRLTEFAEKRGIILIADGVGNLDTVENLWLMGVRNMQGGFFAENNKHPAALLFKTPRVSS